MKTLYSLLASSLLLTGVGYAIPQNAGNFFINAANARLEDFVNRAAFWQGDAPLKGDWERWHDPSVEDTRLEIQRLCQRALVFGLEAEEVTVQKRDDRPERFVVRYASTDSGRDSVERQLAANMGAWAGISAEQAAKGFDHGQLSVSLLPGGDDDVSVALTPKKTP